ncbi:MAG: MFS transporter [Archaeoglobus sp.]|nr:MFS transporter [Archaeoglobus sp.]
MASKYRWVVLFAYFLTGVLSQIVWITFSPILPIVESFYGVGESEVGLLSAVFPITFIFLALPVGYLVDSKGFRSAVLIGTSFLSVFGFLRAFATTFLVLLLFQILASIGQPFIFNSISKLVKGWFPPNEVGVATGIGTLSIYLGIIIGLGITPFLTLSFGLNAMLIVYGILGLVILAIFYLFGKEADHEVEREYLPVGEFLSTLKNRNVILVSALSFLGVGIFTAYTTWVEPILEAHGLGVELAGAIGGLIIVGGIFGSVIIPGLSDKFGIRRPFMVVCLLLAAVLFYTHTLLYGTYGLAANLFILGFFFMAVLPLGLDVAASSVEKKYIGTSNAAVWLFSQIGSLILIFAFIAISEMGWDSTLLLSAGLLFLAAVLAVLIVESPRLILSP